MEKICDNLTEIDKSIDELPSADSLNSNNDFMSSLVKISNSILYLLKLTASLAPDEKRAQRGYIRNQAILVGLFVRLTKLYECLLDSMCKNWGEIAQIFSRLIFETRIKLEYLMQSGPSSYRSFVISSLLAEKEILEDIEAKKKKGSLLPIEIRMLRSVKNCIREARMSKKELLAIKGPNLDGKNFRQILKDLGQEQNYIYAFRTPSHLIHGDWVDLLFNHLQKEGRFYHPKIEHNTADPRLIGPISISILDFLFKYIKKLRLNGDHVIVNIAKRLREKLFEIEGAHESFLQKNRFSPPKSCNLL